MDYIPLIAVANYLPIDTEEAVDIEELGLQALERLNVAPILEHVTEVVDVNNYVAPLPKGIKQLRFVDLLQETKSKDINSLISSCGCSNSISEATVDCTCCDGSELTQQQPVNLLEKQVCRIRHQGIVYMFDYYAFVHSNYYKNAFTPMKMRRTRHSTKLACKTCHVPSDCSDTYEILPSNKILTSVECGQICLDYFKLAQDEDGEFLIPDDALLMETISKYILYKHWEFRWNMKEQGAGNYMREYKKEWGLYQAKYKGTIGMREIDIQVILQEMNKNIRSATTPNVFNSGRYV